MVTSERQSRELSRVEPEQRAAVDEKAIQATGGKITAAAIREAAVEVKVEEVEIVPDSLPGYAEPTPYQKWLHEKYKKRKPSPPPARTEEELVCDLRFLFIHSEFFNGSSAHADDLKRVPRLLARAWHQAVKDDEEQARLDADYLKERAAKTEEAAK
jgi:hypothetical protein